MKRAVFIGRFAPFHKGHLSLMQKKIDEGIPLLILIRDTHYDSYSAEIRKRMIQTCMKKLKVNAKIMIIDDVESFNYGRGVGYEVCEIEVIPELKKISATNIRNMIDEGDDSWKKLVAPGADKVLKDYLSRKGVVVWFTGLSCAGKTTIADAVSDTLRKKEIRCERLDGDILREHITKDLGFSKKDREKNLERATFIAKILARNGVVVLSSFITPYEFIRRKIRTELEKEATFIEVYVKASLETCKKRDYKGLYEKAEKGIIKNFTGISDPFEEPENADLILDTENKTVEECSEEVLRFIEKLKY